MKISKNTSVSVYVLLIYVSDWSECILALFQVSRENLIFFWRLKGATTTWTTIQLVPNARTWRGPHGQKKILDSNNLTLTSRSSIGLVDQPTVRGLVKTTDYTRIDNQTKTFDIERLKQKRIKLTNNDETNGQNILDLLPTFRSLCFKWT